MKNGRKSAVSKRSTSIGTVPKGIVSQVAEMLKQGDESMNRRDWRRAAKLYIKDPIA